MRTIDLTTKIVNVQTGKPVMTTKTDAEGEPVVENEEYTCKECGQKVGGEPERRAVTVRDYFLTLLGSKFKVKDTKEHFWTTKIGMKMSDQKNETVKLSEDKVAFLKRIVKSNKTKRTKRTPMGTTEEEVELFFPYEVGQLLAVLDVPKDEKIEERKEAEELKKEINKKSE